MTFKAHEDDDGSALEAAHRGEDYLVKSMSTVKILNLVIHYSIERHGLKVLLENNLKEIKILQRQFPI